jgi:hypothetical protein
MEGDDDKTETITDNVSRVEWEDDDTVDLTSISGAEALLASVHRITGMGHAVEFVGRPRSVVVTWHGQRGDTLHIHERADGRTYEESLRVAAARLERFVEDYQ